MQTAVRIHTEVLCVMTTLSVMNSLPYGRCRQYVHKDLQKSMEPQLTRSQYLVMVGGDPGEQPVHKWCTDIRACPYEQHI